MSVLTLDAEDTLSPLSSLGSVSDEVVYVKVDNNDDDDEEQFQVEVPGSTSAARSSSSSSSATLSSKCKRAPSWVWAHFASILTRKQLMSTTFSVRRTFVIQGLKVLEC